MVLKAVVLVAGVVFGMGVTAWASMHGLERRRLLPSWGRGGMTTPPPRFPPAGVSTLPF